LQGNIIYYKYYPNKTRFVHILNIPAAH